MQCWVSSMTVKDILLQFYLQLTQTGLYPPKDFLLVSSLPLGPLIGKYYNIFLKYKIYLSVFYAEIKWRDEYHVLWINLNMKDQIKQPWYRKIRQYLYRYASVVCVYVWIHFCQIICHFFSFFCVFEISTSLKLGAFVQNFIVLVIREWKVSMLKDSQ